MKPGSFLRIKFHLLSFSGLVSLDAPKKADPRARPNEQVTEATASLALLPVVKDGMRSRLFSLVDSSVDGRSLLDKLSDEGDANRFGVTSVASFAVD